MLVHVRPLDLHHQECSQITPWLYLSGEGVATDLATLRRHGVTVVVNCAASVCPSPFEHEGIHYLALALGDSPDEDILVFVHRVVEVGPAAPYL